MDVHGVEQATVVCAAIENNPDNVEYVSFAQSRYPGRLHVIADLDCTWHQTYHQPGSADRLRALADRYELTGFTHYVGAENDGWLTSEEADELLTVAGERRLLFSLAASPLWQEDLRVLARRHPDVPILCHHLGGASAGADPAQLRTLLDSVSCPNIYIKASGFHYASSRGWDYPWTDAIEVFRQIFEVFGPERLCWASDFPASTRHTTYRQSLEAFRTHCTFLGVRRPGAGPRRHPAAHSEPLSLSALARCYSTPDPDRPRTNARCARRNATTIGSVVSAVAANATFSGTVPY